MHAGVSMCVDKQATVDKFATLLAHFNDQVCACGWTSECGLFVG